MLALVIVLACVNHIETCTSHRRNDADRVFEVAQRVGSILY